MCEYISENTKIKIRELVKLWDEGIITTYFELNVSRMGSEGTIIFYPPEFENTLQIYDLGFWKELIAEDLIRARIDQYGAWDITLLSKLRKCVVNNFSSSELSSQTINNYIIVLPEELKDILGEQFLKANPDIEYAISDLVNNKNQETRPEKAGKLASFLGQALQNTTNAISIIQALAMIKPLL